MLCQPRSVPTLRDSVQPRCPCTGRTSSGHPWNSPRSPGHVLQTIRAHGALAATPAPRVCWTLPWRAGALPALPLAAFPAAVRRAGSTNPAGRHGMPGERTGCAAVLSRECHHPPTAHRCLWDDKLPLVTFLAQWWGCPGVSELPGAAWSLWMSRTGRVAEKCYLPSIPAIVVA